VVSDSLLDRVEVKIANVVRLLATHSTRTQISIVPLDQGILSEVTFGWSTVELGKIIVLCCDSASHLTQPIIHRLENMWEFHVIKVLRYSESIIIAVLIPLMFRLMISNKDDFFG
jgi:hypothetical protein